MLCASCNTHFTNKTLTIIYSLLPCQAEVGTPLMLLLVCRNARSGNAAREYLYFQLMPKALVSKMPGYFFSSYGVTARINPPMVIVGPQVNS